MTFLPNPLDSGNNPLGYTDETAPPIVQNLPNTMAALQRKWDPASIQALRSQFPNQANAYLKWEYERAQRGIYPANPQATFKMLKSAKKNSAQTAAPERDPLDFLGNAAADLGDIVTSIPKLPVAVWHEAQDLGNFAQRVREGGGGIQGLLSAPGVNLIPGAYTARNIVTGDWENALSHPLMTTLDVLPAVGKLGIASKLADTAVGKAAIDATEPMREAFGRTTLGQLRRETWGNDTRALARSMNEYGAGIARAINPNLPEPTFIDATTTQLARDTHRWAAESVKAVPEAARREAITNALKFDQNALNDLNLSDAELAMVDRGKQLINQYQDYGISRGKLVTMDVQGTPETFTQGQASRIQAARNAADRAGMMSELRSTILAGRDATNTTTPDFVDLRERVATQLSRDDLSMSDKRKMATGLVHAMDAHGIETGTLLHDIYRSNRQTLPDIFGSDEMQAAVEQRVRRRSGQPPMQPSDGWLRDNKKFTEKYAQRVQDQAARAEIRAVPARWVPHVEQNLNERVVGAVTERVAADSEAGAQMADYATNRAYKQLVDEGVIDPEELAKWKAEARMSWKQMRDQGMDPQFIHQVGEGQARGLTRPASVSSIVPSPSQFRERTFDFTPTHNDLVVSVSHQGMELLQEQGSRAFLNDFRDSSGVKGTDLQRQYWETAKRYAARRGTSVAGELERLIRKEWVKFSDTEAGFVRGGKFNFSDQFNANDVYVPRHLARALERVAAPPGYAAALNPVLGVFRTSVLPFSLRWQSNNIFGGMMMAAMEDPRILMELPRAFKVARELRSMNSALAKGEVTSLSADVGEVINRMSPGMRASLDTLEFSALPDDVFRYNAGTKLGDLFMQARASRLGEGINEIGKVGGKYVKWAYETNQMFDDMYRAASYLSGERSALTKGLSAEEAAARGEALAKKVMPEWNALTPMERSVFRVVFPFYSFMQHIIRYAYRYGHDHPFRTAVIASLVRNEQHDFGTGLPQALMSAFFLGKPDKNGNVTAIDPGAANPFRDLGDNLTIAGFLSQTNPIFKVALQQMGYDPQSRGPNLYPELMYDSETGKFKQVPMNTPSLAGGLISSIIPQANLIGALAGTSADFKQLLRTNPDAAKRMMLSQAGIPLMWRDVNVPEQQFQAELNRQTDAKAVLSTALKTGNWQRAMQYPTLRPYAAQIQKLVASGKLNAFQTATSTDVVEAQKQLLGNLEG